MALSEFGKAFRDARKSGVKTFMFKGKKYTTETKEEKDARLAKAKAKAKADAKPKGPSDSDIRRANIMQTAALVDEATPARRASMEARKEAGAERMAKAKRKAALEARAAGGQDFTEDFTGMKKGGKTKSYRSGGRIDGCAVRGKTKGRMC